MKMKEINKEKRTAKKAILTKTLVIISAISAILLIILAPKYKQDNSSYSPSTANQSSIQAGPTPSIPSNTFISENMGFSFEHVPCIVVNTVISNPNEERINITNRANSSGSLGTVVVTRGNQVEQELNSYKQMVESEQHASIQNQETMSTDHYTGEAITATIPSHEIPRQTIASVTNNEITITVISFSSLTEQIIQKLTPSGYQAN